MVETRNRVWDAMLHTGVILQKKEDPTGRGAPLSGGGKTPE